MYACPMTGKKVRVLVIDDEKDSGREIAHDVREACAGDTQTHVHLAGASKNVEKLLQLERRKHRSPYCLALVNASADLGNFSFEQDVRGPIQFALELQEQRRTPVLIYSPLYREERLSQLQEMLEGTFATLDVADLPEAVRQHLNIEPLFSHWLQIVRSVRAEVPHVLQSQLCQSVEMVHSAVRIAMRNILTTREAALLGWA